MVDTWGQMGVPRELKEPRERVIDHGFGQGRCLGGWWMVGRWVAPREVIWVKKSGESFGKKVYNR